MKKVLRFLEEKNPWADDVTLNRENFRADPLRAKMAEMENDNAALRAKVAEMEAPSPQSVPRTLDLA